MIPYMMLCTIKRNFVSPRGHVISSIYVDDDIDIGIDQDDKKKDSYTLTKPHKIWSYDQVEL